MPKPSNRPKLLAVGHDLIHECGFGATSVRDVVQAAGVPHGCFTNHFATKEAFGLEVINQHFASTQKVFDRTLRNEELPPLKRIEAYFDVVIEHAQGDSARKGCLFGNFGIEASPHSEAIRERIVEIFGELEESVEHCVKAAVLSGALPADQNMRDTAELVTSSIQGAILLAKIRRSPLAIRAVKRVVFTTVLANPGRLLQAKARRKNTRRQRRV